MRRTLLIGLTVIAIALVAPAAGAKGPTSLRVTGLDGGPIDIAADPAGSEIGAPLIDLAMAAGMMAALPSVDPSLAATPPDGDLGQRLVLRWAVMGPDGDTAFVQDLYPWAEDGAVTHTAAGQDYAGVVSEGGWYVGGEELTALLTQIGVPAQAPRSGPGWVVVALAVLAVLVVVTVAGALLRQRRGGRRDTMPAHA